MEERYEAINREKGRDAGREEVRIYKEERGGGNRDKVARR